MRGIGGFNVAILEGFAEWGVSGHFVDRDFDTGDLVRVDRFPIAPGATALSLDIESQARLLALFQDVVDMAVDGAELPRTPQGEGRYVTRDEFEAMRRVPPGEDAETLERRITGVLVPALRRRDDRGGGDDGQPGGPGAARRGGRGEQGAGRLP